MIFVPFGLPGDTLRVSLFREEKRHAYASIQEVLKPSQDRVDPLCPYFFTCGGCQWQHLKYEQQLSWKETILRETLERVGKIKDPPVRPVIGSPETWHYRSRIQLHVGDKGEIGFYRGDGDGIVPIESCSIADERINTLLKKLDPREIRKRGWEVELMVDEETGEVILETGKAPFSQVNRQQNEKLVATVVDLMKVKKGEEILELFAGNGNFSFPLAIKGAKVIAVEQSPSEGVPVTEVPKEGSVQFVYNKVEKIIREMVRARKTFDGLLLDPPRKGAKFVLSSVVALKPKKIVYVSCFPPTLARDLSFLTRNGYRLETVQPIDMFPQTHHIESVSLLHHL
ncbi:MAG: class I SAM-dependent RNA methyltransferase [Deltaproteobacteria bacterium]|nr:class I SAM-dependent RNA methyltransferase [Deltaproteobacteria bacterium]